MKLQTIIFAFIGAIFALLTLFVWFITLMAMISQAAWSLATGLAGLILLAIAAAAFYMAYAGIQQEKMSDARYHNMERQVLALAKKNKGTVTVADLINTGFESDEAEKTLDAMAKKGICDINLDATQLSGITTYSFPELIPLGKYEDQSKV